MAKQVQIGDVYQLIHDTVLVEMRSLSSDQRRTHEQLIAVATKFAAHEDADRDDELVAELTQVRLTIARAAGIAAAISLAISVGGPLLMRAL